MTKEEEFEKLLIEYGNSMYNCGSWDEEDEEVPYNKFANKADEARAKVQKYVEKIMGRKFREAKNDKSS